MGERPHWHSRDKSQARKSFLGTFRKCFCASEGVTLAGAAAQLMWGLGPSQPPSPQPRTRLSFRFLTRDRGDREQTQVPEPQLALLAVVRALGPREPPVLPRQGLGGSLGSVVSIPAPGVTWGALGAKKGRPAASPLPTISLDPGARVCFGDWGPPHVP